MFRVIKKADIVLFIALVCASLAVTWLAASGNDDGRLVRVSVDGEPYGTYSLSEDQSIEINQNNHLNKITIKDGQVQMSESSCRNQICVKDGSISKANQTIVCLPNRVMIEVTGKGAEFDAVSN